MSRRRIRSELLLLPTSNSRKKYFCARVYTTIAAAARLSLGRRPPATSSHGDLKDGRFACCTPLHTTRETMDSVTDCLSRSLARCELVE